MFASFRLQRYVLFDCVTFFLLALCAFIGVLLTVQLLRLSDLVVNRGVAGGDIVMMFVAVVPTFLELAIPMAAVVGVMLAVSRLSADAELVVMRASGVSLYQILPAVLAFGLILAFIGVSVAQYFKPWGYRTVSELLFKIARDRTTAGLEPGVFNKLGMITLYPEQINYQTGELTRVLLDQRQSGAGRRIFFAQSGLMSSDPVTRSLTLELYDGEIHEESESSVNVTPPAIDSKRSKPNAGTIAIDRAYSMTRFASNSIDIGPEMLGANERGSEPSIRTLTAAQLKSARDWYLKYRPQISGAGPDGIPLIGDFRQLIALKTKKELDKRQSRIDTELAIRWSLPFSALILALIAFPLGVQPPRGQSSWGASASLGLGIGIFLLYYGLLSIGLALADSRTISSVVAVWIPNFAAAIVAVLLNREICSERIQSVGEILEKLIHGPLATVLRRLNFWRARSA